HVYLFRRTRQLNGFVSPQRIQLSHSTNPWSLTRDDVLWVAPLSRYIPSLVFDTTPIPHDIRFNARTLDSCPVDCLRRGPSRDRSTESPLRGSPDSRADGAPTSNGCTISSPPGAVHSALRSSRGET